MTKLFSIVFVFCLLHISSTLGSSNENEEPSKRQIISWQQFEIDTKDLAAKLKATGNPGPRLLLSHVEG